MPSRLWSRVWRPPSTSRNSRTETPLETAGFFMKLHRFPKLHAFAAGAMYANSVPHADEARRKTGKVDVDPNISSILERGLTPFSTWTLWEAGKMADEGVQDKRLPLALYEWLDTFY